MTADQSSKQEQLTVTVLICVRDGANYLAEAVGSALAQTEQPLEVLVIDDGSVDGSAAVGEAVGATVVRRPALGLGAARNEGFQRARGALVVVLDADDLLLPHALAALREAVQAAPAAIGCVGRLVEFVSPELVEHPAFKELQVDTTARRSVLLSGGMWRREVGLGLAFDTDLLTPDLDWMNQQRERHTLISEIEPIVVRRRVHLHNMTRRADVKASYLAVARAAIARRREGLT